MFKILKISAFLFLIQHIIFAAKAQEVEPKESESNFKSIKEFMEHNLYPDFLEKSDKRYLSYLCKVDFSEVVPTLEFSENTSSYINQRQAVLEARLQKFVKDNGIAFEQKVILIYPVIQIWKDKKPRVDNVEEMLSSLFGKGVMFEGSKGQIRIESPLVISVLGVIR